MRPDLGGVLRLPDVANLVRSAAGRAAEADGRRAGAGGPAGRGDAVAFRPAPGNPGVASFPRLELGVGHGGWGTDVARGAARARGPAGRAVRRAP